MKSFDDISLSAKAKKVLAARMASGRYGSPKEVLENALTLLESADREHDARLEDIRRGVRRGIEAADRGEVVPLKGLVERVRAKAESRRQPSKRRKSA